MKMHFSKTKPRVIRYRKYKIFNNDAFEKSFAKRTYKAIKYLR